MPAPQAQRTRHRTFGRGPPGHANETFEREVAVQPAGEPQPAGGARRANGARQSPGDQPGKPASSGEIPQRQRNKNMTTVEIVNNGVNVGALLGARDVLKAAPPAAAFTWRASCQWVMGTHSRT